MRNEYIIIVIILLYMQCIDFSNQVLVTPAFIMKSLFTSNSRVVYKAGSLASGDFSIVTNY